MRHLRLATARRGHGAKSTAPRDAQRHQGFRPPGADLGTGTPSLRAVGAPTPARDAEAFRCQSRDERGSVTIWMATASFVMITLVGLAVDLGGQVHAQQRAHDLAAQAARTGGQEVQAAPAVEGRYANIDTRAARQAAEAYLSAAGVDGAVSVHDGNRIVVSTHTVYRTKFLGLVGITKVTVHGSASAHLVRSLGGEAR